MAVHIDTSVYIDGINRTSHTVLPLKFGNFLDERLDELNLSLRSIKRQNFAPLTPVEVNVKITEYFGVWNSKDDKRLSGRTEDKTFYYVIGNDSASEFRPGSGLYNHELYCIEVTKIAECIVVDSLTTTNDIGRTYTADAALNLPQEADWR